MEGYIVVYAKVVKGLETRVNFEGRLHDLKSLVKRYL